MKDKKGFTVGDMLPLGLTIVILGIGLALGLTVLDDFGDDKAACSTGYTYNTTTNVCFNASNQNDTSTIVGSNAYNGTQDASSGLSKFTSYLPTIALVIVVAVIIGILVRYLFIK